MSITGLGQWSDWWMYSGFSGKVGGGDEKIGKNFSVQVHKMT